MSAPPVEMHACRACGVELPETDLTLYDVTFHDDLQADGQDWFYCAPCLAIVQEGAPDTFSDAEDERSYRSGRELAAAYKAAGWGSYSAGPGDPHGVLHYCEDGHHWTEQPDGGVSPSWGYGLSSIHYDQAPDRCPEPERGHSRYDDGGPDHGYRCPDCGEVHYCGGCGMGVRSDPWNAPFPACRPPEPHCGKPAVRTLIWRKGNPKHGITAGWFDPTEPTEPKPGEQLALI